MAVVTSNPGVQDDMDGHIHHNQDVLDVETADEPENEASVDKRNRQDSRLYKKVIAFNDFIDETAKGLTAGEFQVWCVLYRFENSGLARASIKTIGERVGKGERQAARYIAGLIKKGVLELAKKGGSNGRCNEYRLGIKTLAALPKPRKPKPKSPPKPR